MQVISKNQPYFRTLVSDRRSVPFLTLPSTLSFLKAINNLQQHAAHFSYPYLMLLGEFDQVISNKEASRWHSNTPGTLDKSKVFLEDCCHQVHKDQKQKVWRAVMTFIDNQLNHSKSKAGFEVRPVKQGFLRKSWWRLRIILKLAAIFLLASSVIRRLLKLSR